MTASPRQTSFHPYSGGMRNLLCRMNGNVFQSIPLPLQLLFVRLCMRIIKAIGSSVGYLIGSEHTVEITLQDPVSPNGSSNRVLLSETNSRPARHAAASPGTNCMLHPSNQRIEEEERMRGIRETKKMRCHLESSNQLPPPPRCSGVRIRSSLDFVSHRRLHLQDYVDLGV